jgi:hypothetical protein
MQIGVAFVQKTLFADLKAICTDPMDWLGATHRLLQDISDGPGTNVLKFIAIFFHIPCLELG